jgi:DNA (cytosine-5)-methyltransferase 1
MAAYYNEIDPYAAQWLRNLIAAGHIAPGDVDERSINDVKADDLKSYTQCHFFAGIGVWSHALRLAGWPDDRPVWTGSCPCQPFSAAGKQQGTADDRHLWPVWFNLIRQRKPAVVFGEQVEAAIRHGWLDLVQTDLEGTNYRFAAVGIPAAGFGAPHIRQRLWFVADSAMRGRQQQLHIQSTEVFRGEAASEKQVQQSSADGPSTRRLDNNNNPRLEGQRGGHQTEGGRDGAVRSAAPSSESVRLEHGDSNGRIERRAESGERSTASGCGSGGVDNFISNGRRAVGHDDTEHDGQQLDAAGDAGRTGPTNGHWRNADWLHCRDGKWRPVEPGTFPLAYGAAARVGRLRAYGNAIVPQVAAEVIAAYMLG